MSKKSIDIEYESVGENEFIVNIFVDNKNQNLSFGLCEFENEMEYLGFATKLVDIDGKSGFLFSKTINKEMLEREIKRFAAHYDII